MIINRPWLKNYQNGRIRRLRDIHRLSFRSLNYLVLHIGLDFWVLSAFIDTNMEKLGQESKGCYGSGADHQGIELRR